MGWQGEGGGSKNFGMTSFMDDLLTLYRFVCQMQACFGGRLASSQWLCYSIEKTWSQNQSPKASGLRSQLQKVMKREKCQVFHSQGLLDCEHDSRSPKLNVGVFWLQLLIKYRVLIVWVKFTIRNWCFILFLVL